MKKTETRRDFVKKSLLAFGGVALVPNFISCDSDDDFLVQEQNDQNPNPEDDSNGNDNSGGENPNDNNDGALQIPEELKRTNFNEGVASFDPTSSGVIVWTRYETSQSSVDISWQVSTGENFKEILREGTVTTDSSRDYTLAIELRDLDSGMKLYYRFLNLSTSEVSDVGETITVESDPSQLNFAVCACSRLEFGYFNAYNAIVKEDKADIVIHLGDYIYDYGNSGNSKTFYYIRKTSPDHSPETLDDFRERYKDYRREEDLKELHRKKPFIVIWDNHDTVNSPFSDPTEKLNSIQAYSEYLPAITNDISKIFRKFEYGSLMKLMMLDTRLYGREKSISMGDYKVDPPNILGVDLKIVDSIDSEKMLEDLNKERTLLGQEQKDWLLSELNSSGAQWNIIGNQVQMARLALPEWLLPLVDSKNSANIGQLFNTITGAGEFLFNYIPKYLFDVSTEDITDAIRNFINAPRVNQTVYPFNFVQWDGYPSEREELLQAFRGKNVTVLSGDMHFPMYSRLIPEGESESTAVELLTGGITSMGIHEEVGFNDLVTGLAEDFFTTISPEMEYVDGFDKGYTLLEVSHSGVLAHWMAVDTIKSKSYTVTNKHTFKAY